MFHHHLRNELWKLFGKKRTYIGFGAFLLAQNILLLFFQLGPVQRHMERLLAGNGYLAKEYMSALTVALIMLLPQVLMFMPLYAALVGGDLVAKEAEDGTLRLILARPISRFQLLLAKWFSGAVFSILLVTVLGITALLFARIWFPWRSMFISIPGMMDFSVLPADEGFRRYLFSHFLTATNATVMLGIAFMFSCFNMKPAAATILALSFLFLNLVMESIQAFAPYREWFLTYHLSTWRLVFAKPIPWWRIIESLCVLVAYNLTAFLVGAAAFHARDIKS
jgi:ABC-2 type transport system permease protein